MGRIIKPGGTRGSVFRQVGGMRLLDSRILLENKRYAGAIYLAGYAVECLLKWAVTCRRECLYLPQEWEIHDLDSLLVAAGLELSLIKESELRAIFWALAESWGPELRYLAKPPEPNEASSLYRKIVRVYDWIIEQRI